MDKINDLRLEVVKNSTDLLLHIISALEKENKILKEEIERLIEEKKEFVK